METKPEVASKNEAIAPHDGPKHSQEDPAARSLWLFGLALGVTALLVGLMLALLASNSDVNQIGVGLQAFF